MPRSIRELTWQSLSESVCEGCGSEYDLKEFEEANATESDYAINYVCPDCGCDYLITSSIKDDILAITTYNQGEDPVNQQVVPTSTVELREHDASNLIGEIYRLVDVVRLLLNNSRRVLDIRDEFPRIWDLQSQVSLNGLLGKVPTEEITLGISDLKAWQIIQVEVHNYLAAAYTFDQILEGVKPKINWDAKLEEDFKRYKTESRPVLGLRHYCQHEDLLPLEVRVSRDGGEFDVDIIVERNSVQTMESQISDSRPDGYKQGAEFHFSEVAREINVSTRIGEHCGYAGELATDLLEHTLENNREEIENYEELRDNQPTLQSYDFSERPSEWDT